MWGNLAEVLSRLLPELRDVLFLSFALHDLNRLETMLVGTGFRGTWTAPDPAGAPVLAADIPSGVDGLTGAAGPGVRPATLLVLITATVTGASFFTEPYLLTGQGGPDNASVSPVLLMYREAITQNHPGYAAAIGVMLAVVVLAISAIYRLVLEKD